MSLTFNEKIRILDSYKKLRKGTISLDRINYYHDCTKNRRKTVVRELKNSGNGYVYVGYIEKYRDKADSRGFINIDKHISSVDELRILIEEAIISFE